MRRPAVAVVAACWAFSVAADPLTDLETWAGLPRASAADATVLRNPGFLVGYSEARRQPLWVAYRAESLKGAPPLPPRPRFEPDPRTRAKIAYHDYRKSTYTRGHLAPNYLIARLYGPDAQRATFLMSNIAPQKARLNQLVWERLESAEADVVAPNAILLWVVTGPLFGERPGTIKAGIAVPEAFYRIWLDLRDGQPHALGFVVPQDVCGTEPLSKYLASVDEIEQRSGLDFFSDLEDVREAGLEASRSTEGWRIERWNRRKPRYAEHFGELDCAN